MAYAEAKIYFDGSHYVAIPKTEGIKGKRTERKDEEITVKQEDGEGGIITTKKELFESIYKASAGLRKSERKLAIKERMQAYFDDEDKAEQYVEENIERKKRNAIARRIRMQRKVQLQEFNYFCTFTYDNAKHDEESFKRVLKTTLRHFGSRKEWKYIGVWERAPKTNRLHFHGIFQIPDGTMPGKLLQIKDYDVKNRRMRITWQSLYFNERFGRSDFERIESRTMLNEALTYILKYIEKSGERIVCSKGLPQYFISDVADDDVVCRIGLEDRKLLLYDDFGCWDEGCYMGKVSKATIRLMRKSN